MKKLSILVVILYSFSSANEFCSYVSKDAKIRILIDHNCTTATCDNVKARITSLHKIVKSGEYLGSSKGTNMSNIEFSFKKGMQEYLIRKNEFIITNYGKLVQSIDLTPCEISLN